MTERPPVRGQMLPPSLQGRPAQSVPEARPTPLRAHYISLSVMGLIAGTVAITAIELGASLSSPLVKLCVAVGAPPLALAMADATLRIWRSVWAWWPEDHGRALFRLVWLVAMITLMTALAAVAWVVLIA